MSIGIVMLVGAALSGFSVRLTDESPPTAERWASDVVTYAIELAGSDDLPPEAALDAVRAGFRSWVDVDCATVTFQEVGDAPDPHATLATTAAPDGRNDVVWIEDEAWPFGMYVLGVTAPIVGPDHRIAEADIAFNGVDWQWTTSGNGGMDLESVAVHEIGHFIGVQHNIGPFELAAQPTMAPYVASGVQSRTLEPDDQAAACFLYPATPYTCLSDADCPLLLSQTFEQDDFYSGRFRCAHDGEGPGTCTTLERFLPQAVGLGEVCHRPEECRAGLECHPYPAAPADGADITEARGVCTTGCDPYTTPTTCPTAFHCEAFPAPLERAGVCLPDDGRVLPPGEGPDGCLGSAICAPGKACLPPPTGDVRRCALLCPVADGDAGCPPGEGCWGYGAATGGCFDRALFPPEPEPEPVPEPSPEGDPDAAVEFETTVAPDPEPGADVAPDRSGSGREGSGGCAGGALGGGWFALAMVAATRLERRRRR